MDSGLQETLAEVVGADAVRAGASLAPYTTFGIGGPADWLVKPRGESQIAAVLRLAARRRLPVTLLGGGSNVLVADRGVRGLVIRPHAGTVRELAGGRVRADAALTLHALVRWTIARGYRGLEAWAGTPGSVGGAVHGNVHFAGRPIAELIASVRIATRAGEVSEVDHAAMAFGYDASRLQTTGEVLLSAVFHLQPGADPSELRAVARRSLAERKRTQPLAVRSAGCVFQNPRPDEVPPGVPVSAGALIDRAGMKGRALGGARVSLVHANFIVNEGGATAAEVRALVEACREAVLARFGVRLRDEIVYLGEWDKG